MSKHSLLAEAGLPDSLGIVILSLSLILLLAPYLAGTDLGVIKIPAFSESARRYLRFFGPVAMIAAVLLHLPFISEPKDQPVVTQPGPPPNAPQSAPECVIAG